MTLTETHTLYMGIYEGGGEKLRRVLGDVKTKYNDNSKKHDLMVDASYPKNDGSS